MFGDLMWDLPKQFNSGRRSSTQSNSTFGRFFAANSGKEIATMAMATTRKIRMALVVNHGKAGIHGNCVGVHERMFATWRALQKMNKDRD